MSKLLTKLLSLNICVLLLFTGIPSSSTVEDVEWNLVAEQSQTKVYTRKAQNSNLKEIRMVSIFNSDAVTLKEVLSDVPNYPQWVFKCMESERISTFNNNEFHYYLKTDMPYPIANRDLVVYTKNWNEDDIYYSLSEADPNFISQRNGLVRIPKFTSSWKVTPINSSQIQIEYEAATDPGGYLPAWVVNLGITKGPINTMMSLKTEVEKRYLDK